jgi:SAM-dependent methyltransferase
MPDDAKPQASLWGERAADWARFCAGWASPAWAKVAEATGIGAGTRVLDVGCGSGEFCRLAAGRGGRVSGIDAAPGMIEIANRLVPKGDLRVGAMEELPWEDHHFDVVTAFNALQFAADVVVALGEAARVTRRGGRVAVCNWTDRGNELGAVMAALRELGPPPAPGRPPPQRPAVGEPGVLEELAIRVGLEPQEAGVVDLCFEAPDRRTLERAMLAPGPAALVIEHSGEQAARRRVVEAAEPFRAADGSYRFANRFRYVISRAG